MPEGKLYCCCGTPEGELDQQIERLDFVKQTRLEVEERVGVPFSIMPPVPPDEPLLTPFGEQHRNRHYFEDFRVDSNGLVTQIYGTGYSPAEAGIPAPPFPATQDFADGSALGAGLVYFRGPPSIAKDDISNFSDPNFFKFGYQYGLYFGQISCFFYQSQILFQDGITVARRAQWVGNRARFRVTYAAPAWIGRCSLVETFTAGATLPAYTIGAVSMVEQFTTVPFVFKELPYPLDEEFPIAHIAYFAVMIESPADWSVRTGIPFI